MCAQIQSGASDRSPRFAAIAPLMRYHSADAQMTRPNSVADAVPLEICRHGYALPGVVTKSISSSTRPSNSGSRSA